MKGVRELEYAIRDLGFIGAHFYPHWFEIPPDAAKVYPFYAKCVELDIPIQMQVGQSMNYDRNFPRRSVGRPIALDAVACDFPELKLIGIHVGIPWTDEMIAMAWKHQNVFIGSDAHAPKYWPESFTHYINTYGQDKVIFGTDFPVLDFGRTVDEIDSWDCAKRPGVSSCATTCSAFTVSTGRGLTPDEQSAHTLPYGKRSSASRCAAGLPACRAYRGQCGALAVR